MSDLLAQIHSLEARVSKLERSNSIASVPLGTILEYSGTLLPAGFLWADGAEASRTTYADYFGLVGTTYGVGNGSTTFNVPNRKGRFGVGLNTADALFDTIGEIGGSKNSVVVLHAHDHTHTHTINHDHGSITSGGHSVNHTHTFSDTSTAESANHNHGPTAILIGDSSNPVWILADGSNRVVSKGATNDDTGQTHTHTISGTTSGANVSHTHAVDVASYSGSSGNPSVLATDNAGVSGTNANLPPYIVMNYIVKV